MDKQSRLDARAAELSEPPDVADELPVQLLRAAFRAVQALAAREGSPQDANRRTVRSKLVST
jgi:hypothetical protein